MTTTTKRIPWKCTVCKQPIELEPGFIELYDNSHGGGKPDGYPSVPTPDFYEESAKRAQASSGFTELSGATLAKLAARHPNVSIRVGHHACLQEESGAYAFPAPTTIEAWIGWILHLREKTWMGREDLAYMLRFWYDARGIDIPHT